MKRVYIMMFLLVALTGVTAAYEPEYRSKNYPDGGIMYDGYFIGDKPQNVTRYYRNGHVQSVQQFDAAGNSTIKMFTDAATLFAEGGYNSLKQREGEWKFYGGNGAVSNIVTFRGGVKEGQCLMYASSGAILDSMNYVADKLDGERVKYYLNGRKMVVFNYKNGEPDGSYISYFEDGGKDMEGTFKNGVRDGVWMIYNEDGTATEYKFRNGKCRKFDDAIARESADSEIDRHIAEPSIDNM